jgi:hypothetical protein
MPIVTESRSKHTRKQFTSTIYAQFWAANPERLGGFQIDRKFEFRRGLHRKVSRLLSFEDSIYVRCRTPVLSENIDPVGDKSAIF